MKIDKEKMFSLSKRLNKPVILIYKDREEFTKDYTILTTYTDLEDTGKPTQWYICLL